MRGRSRRRRLTRVRFVKTTSSSCNGEGAPIITPREGHRVAPVAGVVRVDSGGRLIGALLERGLLDEINLLVHPVLGEGPSWDDERSASHDFTLTHEERRESGLMWLGYAISAGTATATTSEDRATS